MGFAMPAISSCILYSQSGVSCVQAELEDQILQLLSSATGNLLDNIQLINTLNASKTTWEQVNQSLQVCCSTLCSTMTIVALVSSLLEPSLVACNPAQCGSRNTVQVCMEHLQCTRFRDSCFHSTLP